MWEIICTFAADFTKAMRQNAIIIVNGPKRMADFPAFGEPTHARPIASELAWRSLNRGLGHSKDLITLSLSLRYSPTIAYTLLSCAGTRVNIRLSLHPCKGSRSVFYPKGIKRII